MIEALMGLLPKVGTLYNELTSGSRMANLDNISNSRMQALDVTNSWAAAQAPTVASSTALSTVEGKVDTVSTNVNTSQATLNAFSNRQGVAWTNKVGALADPSGYKLSFYHRKMTALYHRGYNASDYSWDLAGVGNLDQRAQRMGKVGGVLVATGNYVTAVSLNGPGKLKYTGFWQDSYYTAGDTAYFHVQVLLDGNVAFQLTWIMPSGSRACVLHSVSDGVGELYFRDLCVINIAISANGTEGVDEVPLGWGGAQGMTDWGTYYMVEQHNSTL